MDGIVRSIVTFITSAVFFVLSTFGISIGTEQPKYDVIERINNAAEIRQYAPRIAAETTVDVTKSDNPRGEAFRIVAAYIFGANKTKKKLDMTSPVEIKGAGEKIAMTAPVEIDKSEKVLTMRFFMPIQYSREQLPEPTDSRVRLVEIPEETAAVLRFTGSTSDAAVSAQTMELVKLLSKTNWKITGAPTALFYNPPWTIPFLRRNEILVAVSSRASSK
jgi:effector-binding domain-containing protein